SAPELCPIRYVHHLRPDDNAVFKLQHSAREDGSYLQLAPDRLRVNLFALIARHRTPRHDFQAGQLRERVDQTFGDAVREVVQVGVAVGIDERQNRQRIYRLAALRLRSPCWYLETDTLNNISKPRVRAQAIEPGVYSHINHPLRALFIRPVQPFKS